MNNARMQAARSLLRSLQQCSFPKVTRRTVMCFSQGRDSCHIFPITGRYGIGGSRPYTQAVYSPFTYLAKNEVTSRVLDVLKSCPQVDPSKVSASAHFEKDLRLDLLDIVEIMSELEQEFAVDISNDDADKMMSCADVINYIAANPQAK